MIYSVDFVYAMGAAFLVSSLSLVGLIYLFFNSSRLHSIIPHIVALSTGVLLGNALFHLIPESFDQGMSQTQVGVSVFAGLISFGIIDRLLSHRHLGTKQGLNQVKSIGMLNLIGDGFHNFIDGLVIGGSFLISPELGMATTVAILIHELPQELGDTGTLIFSGFAPKTVVRVNFIVSTTAIVGVAAVFVLNHWIHIQTGYLLGFTAGGFTYMAIGNLLPSLYRISRGNPRLKLVQMGIVVAGFCFIPLLNSGHVHHHDGLDHGAGRHAHPMGLIFRESGK
jgi:zinc and cadmium transporter